MAEQVSETVFSTAIMPLPDEPAAQFTTEFALNSANNDWADITGRFHILSQVPARACISHRDRNRCQVK